MSKYLITGGNKIHGTLSIKGAKNSILPLMAASLLNGNVNIIHNVPLIADVYTMIDILKSIGCKIDFNDHVLVIDSSNLTSNEIDEAYVKKMRSSIIVLGAMISRLEHVKIYEPGGCAIGKRPIDLHLNSLRKLGVKIEEGSIINCERKEIIGHDIILESPSVGATENIILAAVKAKGTTRIYNAAKEPEIEDLQDYVNKMGGKVSGAGSDFIEIQGVDKLGKVEHSVIPDRIAIGTYMVASAITGGCLEVDKIVRRHMEPINNTLIKAGCNIEYTKEGLILTSPKKIKAINFLKTDIHPNFPTDMQAQMMALMTLSDKNNIFYETIFENRFMHCSELNKMGANTEIISTHLCKVNGVNKLYGAKTKSPDLRGGAALILAALAAEGESEISNIYHVERGYENIEGILNNLGADIRKI
ncbi:UDP-N-acetylglucosamine 1-carboxyvinyltransferase 1 [Terrisporobacter petrolearius]|uniref:UDP-N-acetylglucosamine 1-carboxyvinyltransferase n=1 Tax=Terrisporobacter petrolearius TaxID=1460447 RepID=UPI0008E73128|nr:UDP-N-acetylglucosamine 1-carboxyvinyltransferase [Terrisporobacter glycolicus]